MKNRVQATAMALLRDLNAGGDNLSALHYISTKPLRDVVAELIELGRRNSNNRTDWGTTAARVIEASISPGIANDAEYQAGMAAANAGNAVYYAVRGDAQVSTERLLAAFENIRQAAEAHAAQIHAGSEPHIRDQAVITARERVIRAVADAALHNLYLS